LYKPSTPTKKTTQAQAQAPAPKTPVKHLKLKEKVHKKLYGSFLNKFGEKDTVFRIIDNRNNNDSVNDKRKVVTGKACSSFSVSELQSISEYLQIKIESKSKPELCSVIQETLKKRNDIH
jgi:ribonucleotide reductase beta subunit family protein with ferritin-like domain